MKIVVDGQIIEYFEVGSGPIVLLLHGWGTEAKNLFNIAKDLSKKFRVIGLDLPGFGGSSDPKKAWLVDDYVDIVAGFLKKIDAENLDLVIGHSFGGRLIIKGVSSNKIRPKKIIFIDSAGVKTKKSFKKMYYMVIAKVGKAIFSLPILNIFINRIKNNLYQKVGSIDYLNSGNMRQTFLNVINEDLLPFVHQINQPTLLIWGKNDQDTPVDDAKKILEELKNGQLVVLKDAGHFSHIDQTENVKNVILEFIK